MLMSILTKLAEHKGAVIAAGAALILLAAYVIPFDSLLGAATAAKGGNSNNDNPNRYKVCEKPFGDPNKPGNQNPPPKCYGRTST
jgi:hypothetical protein